MNGYNTVTREDIEYFRSFMPGRVFTAEDALSD